MRDFIEYFGPVIIFLILFFCGLILMDNYWGQYSCNKYEEATGRDTKWIFMDECYVSSGKEWLTKDEYSKVVIARQGLSEH